MVKFVSVSLISIFLIINAVYTQGITTTADENSPLNAQPTVDEGSEDTTTTSDYYYYYYDGETTGNNDQDTTVAQMTTVGGNQL
uniref:Uncharacterized protein n=1 Tax=Romanomermis culicivorax TaxID=13658 RepID=A0A915HEQ0_ROMCU